MDYTHIRNQVESMIKPKRFKHSLNVEKETAKLCRYYGVDEQAGRLCAILHDCAKGMSDEGLLEYAEKNDIQVDEIMHALPDLLHGPVAAVYARKHFGIEDEDMFHAVWYHTTGRRNMSILEKIIYLADMIEESRSFDGIDRIRKEAYTDLDHALLMACNSTIDYVISGDRLIHPLTIEMRNSIILRGASRIG